MKVCCLLVVAVQCVSGLTATVSTTVLGGTNQKKYDSAFSHKNGRLLYVRKDGLHAAAVSVAAEDLLQTELNREDLGLCHGILHASGVRHLNDMKTLTQSQITSMGVTDPRDRRNMLRVIHRLTTDNNRRDSSSQNKEHPQISTRLDGSAFRKGATAPTNGFAIEVISAEHDIFKGRLFTVEQCEQLNRMAEYHAYSGIGQMDVGWTNQLYTLTDQHMQCKDVPDFLSTTQPIFEQLLQQELYLLFPGRIRKGSIRFESSGEPHLIRYSGRSKGTKLHTDNSKFVSITVNVLLSARNDFGGGGTYIPVMNETIHLEQGEMLIHLGNLEHAGADIVSGVRRLLIGFLKCEWEEESCNEAKAGAV